MKQKLFGLLAMALCVVFSGECYAQNNFAIKGVLVDSISRDSEPYATVRVFSLTTPSKTPVKVDITDDNGKFNIPLNQAGAYSILFSTVGKDPVMKMANLNQDKMVADLDTVAIGGGKSVLGELIVEAAAPLIKAEPDKIAYNVQSDPDSKSNSISDMLRKVPMVTVDGEGNITVNGQGNFKVLVNGKPNNMMTSNAKDIFKSMPASVVKKIEVITSPGAKYDAEGVGGVLNIITNDGTSAQGYNVNLRGNYGKMSKGGNVFGTFQYGKFMLNMNVNAGEFCAKSTAENNREDFTSEENHLLHTFAKNKTTGDMIFGSLDASYEIDSLNLITLSGNLSRIVPKTSYLLTTNMMRSEGSSVYRYVTNGMNKTTNGGSEIGVDYQHTFRKPGEFLTLSYRLNFSPSSSEGRSEYSDIENVMFSLFDQYYKNDAFTREHIAQIDYVNPITANHYIDFGVKYTGRANNSEALKHIANDAGVMVESPSVNDLYNQQRNILAAYADYQYKNKAFAAKAGARYEYTFMDVAYSRDHSRDYEKELSDIVPSAQLTYQLGITSNVNLSYNMRIQRPGISHLNPFVIDTDPMNITYGNPNLDTENIHSLSLGYSRFGRKLMFNTKLSYTYLGNGIEEYYTLNGGVVEKTFGNMKKQKSANFDLWMNWNPTPKTRLMTNLTVAYNEIKSEALHQHRDGFSCNIFANAQQTLPWGINLSAFYMYRSPQVKLQGEDRSFNMYGFTAAKSFLNDALNVSITASRPFSKYMKIDNLTETDTFRSRNIINVNTRDLSVTVSYKFGKLKAAVKKTQRSIVNDDVKEASSSNAAATGVNSGATGM